MQRSIDWGRCAVLSAWLAGGLCCAGQTKLTAGETMSLEALCAGLEGFEQSLYPLEVYVVKRTYKSEAEVRGLRAAVIQDARRLDGKPDSSAAAGANVPLPPRLLFRQIRLLTDGVRWRWESRRYDPAKITEALFEGPRTDGDSYEFASFDGTSASHTYLGITHTFITTDPASTDMNRAADLLGYLMCTQEGTPWAERIRGEKCTLQLENTEGRTVAVVSGQWESESPHMRGKTTTRFDVTRHFLPLEYTCVWLMGEDDHPVMEHRFTVLESKEVRPGIWVPVHTKREQFNCRKNLTREWAYTTETLVDTIKVGDDVNLSPFEHWLPLGCSVEDTRDPRITRTGAANIDLVEAGKEMLAGPPPLSPPCPLVADWLAAKGSEK